jgi:hypothetical protein
MIPEVHACSGYLVITPKRAYRDNAGALPLRKTVSACSSLPFLLLPSGSARRRAGTRPVP